ncbi:alcohol dehydrogenase catalytic domain-containing protein [Rhodococcus sp. ZPP]|nr:alcohol dehydrogenase catalytic domain-containing protein [Rhodococcus sp. ZPP]
MVLGHEGAGTVEHVGARDTHVVPCDHVATSAVLNCGR